MFAQNLRIHAKLLGQDWKERIYLLSEQLLDDTKTEKKNLPFLFKRVNSCILERYSGLIMQLPATVHDHGSLIL